MRAHRPPHRSADTRGRRRHPARVYWVRRFVALTLLTALVVGAVGLGRLLTGLSDGQPDDEAQATSANTQERPGPDPSTASGSPSSSPGPDEGRTPAREKGSKKGRKAPKPPLASPDGPCVDEDVVATPSVKEAVGGSPIIIRLDLTTIESEACRWRVSPETLTMRITSGDDEIWTSRECPGALPKQSLVVRKEHRQRVRVRWSARRSGEDCGSRRTEWALPGVYHVEAAALAGEPRTEQFELTRPTGAAKHQYRHSEQPEG